MIKDLRICYFSSQLPTRLYPQMGMFSVQRMKALKRAGCQVMAINPVGVMPSLGMWLKPIQTLRYIRKHLELPAQSDLDGMPIHYPKWVRLPKAVFGWHASDIMYWQIRREVKRAVESFQPDIILSSWLPDGVAACRFGNDLQLPVVCIADGSDVNQFPERYPGWHAARNVLNIRAAALVFVSETLRSEAQCKGLVGQKHLVLHNAADVELFKPSREDKSDGGFCILGVGRLSPVKGFPVLLEAFADIQPRLGEGARLVIAGDGILMEDLKLLASRLGIVQSVRFTGSLPQEELALLYQNADLLCVPSFSEGSPSVIVEALACGLPVVASSVGGVAEIVDDRTGLLVKPGDPQILGKALLAARERTWDRETIRREAVERFGWETWTEKMLSLLHSLPARQ